MRICFLILINFILSATAVGQNQTFEVFGTISGKYSGKIYLFFEGNWRQNDSAEIKNGKFYFKGSSILPIQARFHLEGGSLIEDVFIDSKQTFLSCNTITNTWGPNNETMYVFTIKEVKGSKTEVLRRSFEKWLATLTASGKTEDEKKQEYYDKLYEFAAEHPNSKVSPYLLAKASTLRYSQVKTLNDLLDTTLKNTYEGKGVTRLLSRLDKSKNQAIGNAFLDVTLKDTLGRAINTKDLRGKYILVDFWASWCVPCRKVNPELKMLYSKLRDRNFEILGVSFDKDMDDWKAAIVKDDLPWMQVNDEKGFSGVLSEYYDFPSIPHSILLDKDGKILAFGLQPNEIEKMIEKVL